MFEPSTLCPMLLITVRHRVFVHGRGVKVWPNVKVRLMLPFHK